MREILSQELEIKMKIAFTDFWPGFKPNFNFITYLFKEVFEEVKVTRPGNCEYLIYNIFGKKHKSFKHCKKIFFNGESSPRPNFDECDYSITSFFEDYSSKNIRIPLWMFYIDWFEVSSWGNPGWLIPVNYLMGENQFSKKKKEKFCCSVFSIPYQNRIDMVDKLNNYKNIDCFGKCHKMQIPQVKNHAGELEKMKVISGYKFSICFENAIPGGWYTEKLLHSKVAGNIPIYYSDELYHHDFNKKCCLNLIDYPNMDYLVEEIIKIDSDPKYYRNILNEPLFKKEPNLDSLYKKLEETLK